MRQSKATLLGFSLIGAPTDVESARYALSVEQQASTGQKAISSVSGTLPISFTLAHLLSIAKSSLSKIWKERSFAKLYLLNDEH